MAKSLVIAGLLLACGWWRLQDPDLVRPFEVDELLTVQHYTWAGIGPSGDPRPVRHVSEFSALPAPTPMQLAVGLYCGFGRWPEPNNQVPNSLMVGLALASGGRDEATTRLPALIGGVVFAVAAYYLCGPVLGWRAAAPLVAFWGWFHPYVVSYSQTARGYTWMLAIQVLMIILAYSLAKSRRPLVLGALCAAAAVFSLLDVVSQAVDWVAPFYLALLLIRPGGPISESADRGAWRRSVVAQGLAVAGIGLTFLSCHLPSVYSSTRQYGLPFDSPGAFLEVSLHVVEGLFPGIPDKGLALLGGVGLAALCLSRKQDPFLRLLVALTLGISLSHYVVGGRFPYARAAGHLIPLVLLGVAFLAESAIRLYDDRAGRVAMFGFLAAATAFLAIPSKGESLASPGVTERLALARDVEMPSDSRAFVLIREGVDYIAAFYSPESWDLADAIDPDRSITLVYFDRIVGESGPDRTYSVLDCVRIPGRTRRLDDGAVSPDEWIVWYPDLRNLGVDASDQIAFIRQSGCNYLAQYRRYEIKYDVYSNLDCLFLPPGPDPEGSSREERVREGIRRFGGRAVVFSPQG